MFLTILVDNFFGVDIRQANVESGRKATCGTAEHEGVRESAQYPRLQPTAEPRNPWLEYPPGASSKRWPCQPSLRGFPCPHEARSAARRHTSWEPGCPHPAQTARPYLSAYETCARTRRAGPRPPSHRRDRPASFIDMEYTIPQLVRLIRVRHGKSAEVAV